MTEIMTALGAVRASTADLVADVRALPWNDSDVAMPSLCDGWTRGHVLTHLARNADGVAETLAGALRGEIVERYPDGWAARNAAIDAGAVRPFVELVADVQESAQRLDRVLSAVADADGWELETEKGHPAKHWLSARWKEVEIHRVDLAAGYGPDRWPPSLVAAMFEREVARLPERATDSLRVTVTADGSLLPDFVDRTWVVGDGEPVRVSGPDWAVLAWLVGRPAPDVLTATPGLAPYN
jgi:maleylpyruvate isomerase